jgi:hypothetical protein
MTASDNSANLGLIVKMDSQFTQKNQTMGVVIEENQNKMLRLDFHYDGSQTNAYGASLVGDTTTKLFLKKGIPSGPPLYMKIQRNADSWTVSYSTDGSSYTTAKTFSFAMNVAKVGVFAGNPATDPTNEATAPAFTAEFDYFFNAGRPIIPQDTNKNTVTTTIGTGQGTIEYVDPGYPKAEYVCGEQVRLRAVPATNLFFGGWRGSLSGAANPATLTVTGKHEVIADFTTEQVNINSFLPMIRKP